MTPSIASSLATNVPPVVEEGLKEPTVIGCDWLSAQTASVRRKASPYLHRNATTKVHTEVVNCSAQSAPRRTLAQASATAQGIPSAS